LFYPKIFYDEEEKSKKNFLKREFEISEHEEVFSNNVKFSGQEGKRIRRERY